MPFTPLHFGLNASIGIILKKYISIPMCILANVIIDIQPLLVIFFDFDLELHGFSHTLLGGTILMLPISIVLGVIIKKVYRKNIAIGSYILGGEVGVILHILLDSFMHKDVKLFWPFSDISFANDNMIKLVNPICIIGYILMIILIVINMVLKKKDLK